MADEKKKEETSIFKSVGDLFKVKLEESLVKARSSIAQEEDNANYQKAVHRDFIFSAGNTGFHEKNTSITFEHEKMMARKNTIVAGIIKTRQNQAAPYTKPSKDSSQAGFKITLKDEEAKLQEIIEDLQQGKIDKTSQTIMQKNPAIQKSMKLNLKKGGEEKDIAEYINDIGDKDLERIAQEILKQTTQEKKKELTQFMVTWGELKDRPFESRKWNFDSVLRALINDTYTHDWIAVEKVPQEGNSDKVHHIVPVDSSTIRYASPTLAQYKNDKMIQAANILYPEKELEALEKKTDALELDPEKVDNNDYKFIQKIRGIIVRAFTPEELCVGSRNPITDIYANGYSVSELELLANTVTAHIFTENHKRTYFSNGFSAKGILHIKAPLNRRKLEALRIQWKHMVSGPKNSFQTPIFAGMDEVQWIPLNQGNIDQEFNNWMQYLIKVICMIYQIDPSEIGFGMKEEGGKGGGFSGDNTEEKHKHSRSKGFVPLMKFFENFINVNVIDFLDSDYKIEFVGLSDEDTKTTLERQEKEVKVKKSVNEIREEDGLAPIPGCDNLILDPVYFQWFSQFSEEGRALAKEMQQREAEQGLDEQLTENSQVGDEETAIQNQAIDEQLGENSQVEAEEGQLREQGVDEQLQQDSDMFDESRAEEESGILETADENENKDVKKSSKIEIYYVKED